MIRYNAMPTDELYTTLSSFYRKKFGCRVHKITIDAGFTCPNRDGTVSVGGCIYCNARGSGNGASSTMSITEQIDDAMGFLRERYDAEKFIAYFQAFSNTYAPIETLERRYREAAEKEDIVGLAIGTRPDCADEDVLDLLETVNRQTYVAVEFGLQSASDETLKRINRGHDFATFADAVERTRKRGIDIIVHVILGLPGETKEDMLATARAISRMDIQGLKLHLLYIIEGTALHGMYTRGEYSCLARAEYIDILCEFLALIPREVVIHRLTGDPHPGELVAPFWALEKNATLAAIRTTMHERELIQGCRCGR